VPLVVCEDGETVLYNYHLHLGVSQVTGHGYGHATRVVEVCRQALAMGHDVIVCTCAPAFIFTRELEGVKVSLISD